MPSAPPVSPNVPGQIFSGDYAFNVNNNYGTIIYKQSAPRVRLRSVAPQPPRKPRDFVGRTQELTQLDKSISAHEAVLVQAPDGFGKTALLKQAANGPAARILPQGVVLIESLDANGRPLGLDDLTQQLFDALYETEPPLKVTGLTARTYLSNTQPLILFDNCQLSATALATLVDLVPQGALLLASSTSSQTDSLQLLKLGPLTRADSLRLLGTKLNLDLDDSNRADLDSLCLLLGDHPLALITVVNTIRERTIPLNIASQTLNSLREASNSRISNPLALAYEFTRLNLSSAERSLLAVAANTPSLSVDPDWLRTATNNSANFNTTLYSLQRMDLLYTNSPRYRLAPGLRALAQLQPADRDDLTQRLSQYLLERLLVRDSDFDYCASELSNILATLDWAINRRLWTLALGLCRAIDPFLTLRGQWDSWKTVLDHALTAARGKGDRPAEAWALHQLGTRAIGVETHTVALNLLNQALELRRALGDETGAAFTQHNLNYILPGIPPEPPDSGSSPKPPAGPNPIVIGLIVFSVGLVALAGLLIGGFLILNLLRTPTPRPIPISPEPPIITPIQPLDTAPPGIFKPFAQPDPVFYGDQPSDCGDSIITLNVFIRDDSKLLSVEFTYRFATKGFVGEPHRLPATDLDNGQFQAVIDVNIKDQAPLDLDNRDGQILWSVSASDEHKNTATLDDQTAQVLFCQAQIPK